MSRILGALNEATAFPSASHSASWGAGSWYRVLGAKSLVLSLEELEPGWILATPLESFEELHSPDRVPGPRYSANGSRTRCYGPVAAEGAQPANAPSLSTEDREVRRDN